MFNMKLNIKNYLDCYAFAPQSVQLSKADRKKALGATIAAGILSLGLFPATLAIVNLIRFKGRVSSPTTQRITREALKALVKPEEVERLNLTESLKELCNSTCTPERMVEILEEIKEQGQLAILNSIPEGGTYTPLQHWIRQGNLQAVRLLIEYGAALRIEDETYSYRFNRLNAYSKSALFQAAQSGHIEIVKYLLSIGERADFAFHDKVTFHFIPVYIYTLANAIKDSRHTPPENASDQCECLRLILKNLTKKERVHQFKIPVDQFTTGYVNAIDWIEKRGLQKESPAKENLLKVLKSFEIKKGEVYTKEELTGPNDITLGELAQYK